MRITRLLLALVLSIVAVQFSACKTAQKQETDSTLNQADENALGDSDSGKAMGLQTVNFPYDSFELDEKAKSILKGNFDVLSSKNSLKIQIEGHCDIRGGIQYNIALGEKRANALKKYLTDMGIKDDRITTISYGKERLLDQDTTEQAHARNRRGNFVITTR